MTVRSRRDQKKQKSRQLQGLDEEQEAHKEAATNQAGATEAVDQDASNAENSTDPNVDPHTTYPLNLISSTNVISRSELVDVFFAQEGDVSRF